MGLLPFLQELWQEFHIPTLLNFLVFSFLFLCFILFLLKFTRGSKLNIPPSPPKLPIIGNLHQLGAIPYRSLQALSKKYGPLMLMHFGQSPTLVISSAEMAKEIMKSHDITFANRPKTRAADILLYGCSDIGFSPYGEYWRQARKTCVLELLSLRKVQFYHFVRQEEVAQLIERIRHHMCPIGDPINLTEMMLTVTNNILTRCSLGKKCQAEEEDDSNRYGELSRKLMTEIALVGVGDFFPRLGWIDVLTGLIPRLNKTFKEADSFLDGVIEEHKILKSKDQQQPAKDFLQILLRLQKDDLLDFDLTRDRLKAILLDILLGGSDTTSTTMEWTMTELVRNPSIMNKAQEEVRRVVGNKPKIEETDINQMGYLTCVIKEALRLHAPAPLLSPRESSTSVKVRGYDVPPKTSVVINAWAIQRDSKLWDRAEEFIPERFENNPIDFKGQDFEFIPFGAGRRGCPGMAFGVAIVEHVIANLLCYFDWILAGNSSPENMDMREDYGLSGHKKVPLHLVPSLPSV